MTTTDKIIAYEMGELRTEEEIVDLFQQLIDSGLCWRLQGHYGRTAKHLLDNGLCHRPGHGPQAEWDA